MQHSPETKHFKCVNKKPCPETCPKIKEIVSFERDLWDLVNILKFQMLATLFKINKKKAIKRSKRLFVFADKTSNTYQIKRDKYNILTTKQSDQRTKRFQTTKN